ncbi:hypothetical protein AQ490_23285 [Wenjunlia vitaminophila]|uniref:HTH cro/C1-type domain-containing protein n=1 Tax=Wenjunlia vitaminophila TaxID=76728 RepID=A0A0T6LRT5_WENVI|nr:helix-turn-helix transcriptional regulator [Wenjunlia vitaminophila]KRV48797.1 hypothetical protein AQ490_23285 [Wenjunlia vitaminophila]
MTTTPRTRQFAAYIREAARRAGYDIDSPRGGGKTAIAKTAGMSPSSVGRMLSGQAMPDPSYLEPLAGALGVPVLALFVQAGLISDHATRHPPAAPVTPIRNAGEQLGLKGSHLDLFEALVQVLTSAKPDPAPPADRP